jgi:hypothetical protein
MSSSEPLTSPASSHSTHRRRPPHACEFAFLSFSPCPSIHILYLSFRPSVYSNSHTSSSLHPFVHPARVAALRVLLSPFTLRVRYTGIFLFLFATVDTPRLHVLSLYSTNYPLPPFMAVTVAEHRSRARNCAITFLRNLQNCLRYWRSCKKKKECFFCP